MIFQNIDFHNVDELLKGENGYKMQRVNSKVLPFLSETVQKEIACFGTGVELRFVIESGEAEIKLFIDENDYGLTSAPKNTIVNVFYGDYQSGYKTPDFYLFPGMNKIKLFIPEEIETLEKHHFKKGCGFSPRVIRLILQPNVVRFVSASGNIRPPKREEYPEKTVLFYGSSITNGADSIVTPNSFAFRTGANFNMDYFNLGFSGNAQIEKEMAEYIVSRKDWDYICIELGANVYFYSEDEFISHVKTFMEILKQDGRPVFCTDLFACYSDIFESAEKTEFMRKVVKEYADKNNFYHVNGLKLLPKCAEYLTTDGVHPSVVGSFVLAENYKKYFGEFLKSL